jgi:hypothetical protein
VIVVDDEFCFAAAQGAPMPLDLAHHLDVGLGYPVFGP